MNNKETLYRVVARNSIIKAWRSDEERRKTPTVWDSCGNEYILQPVIREIPKEKDEDFGLTRFNI